MRHKTQPAEIVVGTGVVTSVTPSPRKPGRWDVVVGESSVRLSFDALDRLGLRVGACVDETLAERIAVEAVVIRAYDRALAMLAARARSAADLRRVLVRKGEPAGAVEVAIGGLVAAGFLDDAQFARQFTRAKAVGAGLSKRRIAAELRRRGVAADVAADAIATTFEEERIDERESIERVAQKKLRMLSRLDPAVQRRRLYAFLARRGYDSDAIGDVVTRLAQ